MNLIEDHFEKLILVNPQHSKELAGRKTDPKEAKWIAELLEMGTLKGSWVPPDQIRELGELTRHRVHLLQDLNRIGQLCVTGNINVSSATTDRVA